MDEIPISILRLCDADECAFNEFLKDARNKSTINELEMEYESWFNLYGKNIDSPKVLKNEFPLVGIGLAQHIECKVSIIAYVNRKRMFFLPY